jgi:predicted Zn-dependent protease
MVSTMSPARTIAGVLIAATLWWACQGGDGSLATCTPARAQDAGDDAARRAVFDFDKFFDSMFGEQTAQQKRALEQVEIAWQDEEQFGRKAADNFLAELRRQNIRVVSRGKEIEYLRKLVALIRPQMHHADRYRSITVLLAESPETDARCFPGGTLVLFRGMLEAAQNEATLVGVIGHELSHIDHGHQLRYLKSMKLTQRTFTSGGMPADPGNMMDNAMLLTSLFARPFRPEDETEADMDGATWTYRAGYDPRELAKLFLRFEQRNGGKNKNVPAFFRTHPYNRQRYDAVRKRYEELMRTEPRADLSVGRRNVWDRVPRDQ